MWVDIDENERPSDAITSFIRCDADAFPILNKLFHILSVKPVSTATPERSFSNLRRLKTWLRNRMKENRLNGLALMAINSDMIHLEDAHEILNLFCDKKNRRCKGLFNEFQFIVKTNFFCSKLFVY